MKNGIDISKWQGAPDWDKLKRQHESGKLDFIIMRAGYGAGVIDPRFEANYKEATERGIPLGAYWYAYWKVAPTKEAQAFLAAVDGKNLKYGIWYDVEYEASITNLDKATRTAKTLEALQVLSASGRYVGLYASTDMINNRLDYARLRGYDIWVAQYGSRNTCKMPYGLWQYTSRGVMPGIGGNVDCDRAYKDYSAFIVGKLATGTAADTVTDLPGEATTPRVTKTLRIGPATKGDLEALLSKAKELSLYSVGTLDIGPMTEGDVATIQTTAAALGLSVEEV